MLDADLLTTRPLTTAEFSLFYWWFAASHVPCWYRKEATLLLAEIVARYVPGIELR